ncbi:MAG: helix-turn-helix transcriptional regulator [Saccharospirillaceae bacterium]|nr:helix-turn-helix transcriptional regulator [Saccharospirillaceae bacterium]
MTDEEFLKALGANISKVRMEKSMSQQDLCSKIEMETSNLSAIENGRQNATALTLKKIGDALGVEVKELVRL